MEQHVNVKGEENTHSQLTKPKLRKIGQINSQLTNLHNVEHGPD